MSETTISGASLVAMIRMAATVRALATVDSPDPRLDLVRRLRPWADATIVACSTGTGTLRLPDPSVGLHVAEAAWLHRAELPRDLRPASPPDRNRIKR